MNPELVVNLCNRREGVGADGVIPVEHSTSSTCKMRIYNADGSEAEMCGNGIRCVADYMRKCGQPENHCTIESMHRQHHASWDADRYTIEMGPPESINWNITLTTPDSSYELSSLDTGVPHVVLFVEDIENYPLKQIAPPIRYHEQFMPSGTNVNVAKVTPTSIQVRTYERGVEDETPACGTGATAVALAAAENYGIPSPIKISFASGDQLEIHYTKDRGKFINTSMTGSCRKSFSGEIS